MSQKNCGSCCQRRDCEGVYGRLGRAEGPSVTLSVAIAFLSPVLVFILTLAAVEKAVGLFSKMVELRTGLGLFAALGATFFWIFGASVLDRRLGRRSAAHIIKDPNSRF